MLHLESVCNYRQDVMERLFESSSVTLELKLFFPLTLSLELVHPKRMINTLSLYFKI